MKKMKSLGVLAIVSIFMIGFYHCTSDEAIFSGFPTEWDYNNLQEVHDAMNVSDTVLLTIADPTIDNILTGPKGTKLFFPENSATLSGGGEALAPFAIQLIEIYKRGDMISHSIQTYDGQSPLVSAGIIWLEGTDANGDQLVFDGVQAIMPYSTDANGYQDAMTHFIGFSQMAPSGPVMSWTGGQDVVPFDADENEFTIEDVKSDWNHAAALYDFDEGDEKTQFSVQMFGVQEFGFAEVYFASDDFTTVTALTNVSEGKLGTHAESIPLGVSGKLVGVALIEGKLNFDIQDVTINGDDEFTMNLSQGTVEQLKALLSGMN